jgi:uncharacterized membrane protein YraQ (UPF0718 family)
MIESEHNLLVLSLLVLAVGPIVYQVSRFASATSAVLDGFVYATIIGLVLIYILPHSIGLGGWPAAVAAVTGLLAPTVLERRLHNMARQVHSLALLLGLVAIALHAFTDGLALTTVTASENATAVGGGHMLPMAILIHRLPIGLTVWFLLRPLYGIKAAVGTLLLVAAATAVGFASGDALAGVLENGNGFGVFQAFVAGSLLHVVLHRSYPVVGAGTDSARWQAGLGALGGGVLLWSMTSAHELGPQALVALNVLHSLALESAPALVFAYVAAGAVYGLLPRASLAWMSRGRSLSQALRGVAFGLPLPICSCGVVPVYRSLVVRGVPATAAMSFLVATPELSLDAVLISLPLLGSDMTIVRVVGAGLVALAVGWGLGRLVPAMPDAADPPPEAQHHRESALQRLKGVWAGMQEVIDSTVPWILLGLALAAAASPLLDAGWIASLPAGLEVELFALLGMPVYVCAAGATPLVAILILKGVSPGAALAFLLTGPATNVTTFGVLSQMHGRRVALAFGALITLLAVALGRLVNALPSLDTGQAAIGHSHIDGSALSQIALAVFVTLCILSLLRQGPRKFIGELFNFLGEGEADDHAAGPSELPSCCDHEQEDGDPSGSHDDQRGKPEEALAVDDGHNCCDR